MKRTSCVIVSLCIVISLLSPVASAASFLDVPDDAPYAEAAVLYQKGNK